MSKNVLFIISHDFAPILSPFGDTVAVTPNLDRLAARGAVFQRHYCNYPLCGPSRASLYSGLYPPSSQRWDHDTGYYKALYERMGTGFATLPHWFRKHGWFTHGFWNFHHHTTENGQAWDCHWDRPKPTVEEWWPSGVSPMVHHQWVAEESRRLMKERLDELLGAGVDPDQGQARWRGPAFESADVPDHAYATGMVTGAVVEFLHQLPSHEPFFAGVGYATGHLPWNSPRRYWDLYDRERLKPPRHQTPPTGVPEWAYGDREPTRYYSTGEYSVVWEPDSEDTLDLLHAYYASVSYWDAQIGRVVEALEQSGRAGDTIIVVTSDHGFNYGQHNYWGKHCLREHSFRTPLLIVNPGSASRCFAGLTEHVDLFPTLCDLAGLPRPEWLEGRSLASIVRQESDLGKPLVWGWRRPMFHDRFREYHEAASMRTERYRYTLYRDLEGRILLRELYDYQADPCETGNLANDPGYRFMARSLEAQLVASEPRASSLSCLES